MTSAHCATRRKAFGYARRPARAGSSSTFGSTGRAPPLRRWWPECMPPPRATITVCLRSRTSPPTRMRRRLIRSSRCSCTPTGTTRGTARPPSSGSPRHTPPSQARHHICRLCRPAGRPPRRRSPRRRLGRGGRPQRRPSRRRRDRCARLVRLPPARPGRRVQRQHPHRGRTRWTPIRSADVDGRRHWPG